MDLLGLELCDAGILVAGGEPPRLLPIDEDCLESPGFALPDKKTLTTGIAAERRARLFPRQIMNRFWDRSPPTRWTIPCRPPGTRRKWPAPTWRRSGTRRATSETPW
ncbi:MAG: hypothetical protein MZU95_00935 [Desulfomicrobium escambiense]|nr:hypothetical protein [Desulfomicrobium escambiense]